MFTNAALDQYILQYPNEHPNNHSEKYIWEITFSIM